jgi:hypothetical protein
MTQGDTMYLAIPTSDAYTSPEEIRIVRLLENPDEDSVPSAFQETLERERPSVAYRPRIHG